MSIDLMFQMPNPVKITGRSSSITNAFVNGIIPCIMPKQEEINEVLRILEMEGDAKCAYCRNPHTEWDHFRPLIMKKRPTGYISEIHNLVPACGKCNQSKGNKHWKTWILSDAKLSPKTRGIVNLDRIIQSLEKFEAWSNPTMIDFEELVGRELWEAHWKNCERLHQLMQESQILSDEIKNKIAQGILEKERGKVVVLPLDPTKVSENNKLKIGIIAQTQLRAVLESNLISEDVIKLLQTNNYSKKTFNLNFPVLKAIDHSQNIINQKSDGKGYSRYYKKPITINSATYLLCSQWYEKDREYLVRWIEYIQKHSTGS